MSGYCFLITKSGVSNIQLYKKICKVNIFQYEFVFVCARMCVHVHPLLHSPAWLAKQFH
jgi:hypothetical protein